MNRFKSIKIYLLTFLIVSPLCMFLDIKTEITAATTPAATTPETQTKEATKTYDFSDNEPLFDFGSSDWEKDLSWDFLTSSNKSPDNEWTFDLDDFLSDIDTTDHTTTTDKDEVDDWLKELFEDPAAQAEMDVLKKQLQETQQAQEQANTEVANIELEEVGVEMDMEIPLDFEFKIPGFLLKAPFIPEGVKKYLETLVFKDIKMTLGAKDFGEGMVVSGVVFKNNKKVGMSDGRPLKMQMIMVDKSEKYPEGFVLFIELPESWKPSQFKPDLKNFDPVTFKNPVLIISSFAFTHQKHGYSVKPGFNIITQVSPNKLLDPSLSSAFLKIKVDKRTEESSIAQLVLSSTPFFKLTLAGPTIKASTIKIADFLDFTNIKLPPKMVSDISSFSLKNPKINIIVGTGTMGQSIEITGIGTIFGKDVHAQMVVARKKIKDKSEVVITLQIKMPNGWNFAQTIPTLHNKFNIEFENPRLIITTHDDPALDLKVGLNFKSSLKLTALPNNTIMNAIKKALDTLVEKLIISGVLSHEEGKSELKIIIPTPKDKMVSIDPNLIDVNKLPLPEELKKELKNIKIQKPSLEILFSQTVQQAKLKGSASFRGKVVPVEVLLQENEAGMGGSITIDAPENLQLSDAISDLKAIDGLKLNKAFLIFSSFDYKDETRNIQVQKGLTIMGDAQLTGPFEPLEKFYDETLAKTIPENMDKSIKLKAAIKANIKDSTFELIMPGRLAIKFDSIPGAKEIISELIIEKMTVAVAPESQQITGGVTIQAKFPFQDAPFEASGKIGVQPGATVIELQKSALKPKFFKWLELSDSGFKVAITPAGIPTNIEMYGGMILNNKTMQFALKAGKNGNAVTAQADDLSIAAIVDLFAKITGKSIPMGGVPALGLKNVDIHIVPLTTTVAGKTLETGGKIKGEMNILDMTGKLDLELKTDISKGDIGITGITSISKLIKNPLMTLDGPGPDQEYGTPDDGPTLSIKLTPQKQEIFISGKFGIPLLKLNNDIDILIGLTKGQGEIKADIFGGAKATFDFNFDLKNLTEFSSNISFDQKFIETLQETIHNGLQDFKKNALKEINKIDEKIKEFEQTTQRTADTIRNNAEKERTEIKRKIKNLKDVCHNTPFPDDIIPCREREAMVPILYGYLGGIYAAETVAATVVETTGKLTSIANKALPLKEIAQASIKGLAIISETAMNVTTEILTKIINISHISGSTSGEKLKKGILPAVSIEGTLLTKNFKINNIAFDFDKVGKSIEKIMKNILNTNDYNNEKLDQKISSKLSEISTELNITAGQELSETQKAREAERSKIEIEVNAARNKALAEAQKILDQRKKEAEEEKARLDREREQAASEAGTGRTPIAPTGRTPIAPTGRTPIAPTGRTPIAPGR